jgi:cytochrome P450
MSRQTFDVAAPADVLAAATHLDPYPYYARIVAERPVHFDDRLGAWVVASAAGVSAVLAHPACRVRPAAEPVPAALVGSPAGEIFRRLVRMNDGALHVRLKPAVSQALAAVEPTMLADVAGAQASALLGELDPQQVAADVSTFAFALPVRTIAALFGIAGDRLGRLPDLVNAYVVAAGPSAQAEEVGAGNLAAAELLEMAAQALDAQRAAGRGPLLRLFGERSLMLANAVGLLSQAYEATAATIGASLLALARHPDDLAAVRRQPSLVRGAVEETLRWDPFVQNMRRFVAEDAQVAGVSMRAGDAALVLSAAASRDPARHADPHRFDLARRDMGGFAFGAGAHACPAHGIASRLAAVGVQRLLDAGVEPAGLEQVRSYRRSAFRTPVFG